MGGPLYDVLAELPEPAGTLLPRIRHVGSRSGAATAHRTPQLVGVTCVKWIASSPELKVRALLRQISNQKSRFV